MPLSAGDKLGPYEILAQIGAGGMGEVYRAHDGKLNRDVAIKVLPAALANDAQYMARFEREAQVLASLNHPNIATVYGVEQGALVMELVEGDNLHGPMPLDEAMAIARQIAAGLEAAHERGIVHRDLKPANIKLTPAGVVKILDFGLAKATVSEPSSSTISPTLSLTMTQAGMILGTAAYMSPEQARGKPVDKRADIWAFGVVLYELLTGKRLFEGEDLTETLASVVKDKADLSAVPVTVRRLIQRCLEKDPKKRLRDIGDMELLLAGETKPVSQSDRSPWIVAACVMTAVAAVSLWAPWRAQNPADRPLVRLDVDLGADVALPVPGAGGSSVTISPDGTRLAYVSGTPTRLFVRRLDQPKATELAGTLGANYPFFSPDGQSVGFSSGARLNKISVEGGAVVPIGSLGTLAGTSWSADGSIVVSEAFGKGLLQFPAGGGPPGAVLGLANGELALANPQILPGGKTILFAAATVPDVNKFTIEILKLADRQRKIVARGGASPRYLGTPGAPGHLIYVNKATMFAVPFDADKMETRGAAVAVLDDVAYNATVGTGQFDFAPAPNGHGTLVYLRDSGASSAATLQWVDPTGRREPLLSKPGGYRSPSISPDGKRIVLAVTEGGTDDVWIYDLQRDTMSRLTSGGIAHSYPIWSPEGRYVVFTSYGQGISQARADGASQPRGLMDSKAVLVPCCFTPDGKWLVYDDNGSAGSQIWFIPVEEQADGLKAGKPEPFLKSGLDLAQGISPDGRWLAYISNESGKSELYVRPFPPPPSGQGGKWQISNGGAMSAVWSHSVHDLIYRVGSDFMAASYRAKGDAFVADKPRLWMAKLASPNWDLSLDGRRALVVSPVESGEAPKQEHEVVFLINFFDYLRQKAPAGK